MKSWYHALADDERGQGGQNAAHEQPFAIISSPSFEGQYKLFRNGEVEKNLTAEEVDARLRELGIDPATNWV
jgi:hypothetical protein